MTKLTIRIQKEDYLVMGQVLAKLAQKRGVFKVPFNVWVNEQVKKAIKQMYETNYL